MVIQGQLARLHRASSNSCSTCTPRNTAIEVYVPYLVNADSLRGTGQLPKFESDLFKLSGDLSYYLIPTAEVPVTNPDVAISSKPTTSHCAMSRTPCFRKAAGSVARTCNMIRQHQFEKVELVQIDPS